MADIYRERGLDHLALKYRTKAIELNPLHLFAYVERSITFTGLGELEKAEIDLQKALEINPDHRVALLQYGSLLIVLKKYDKAEQIISRTEQIYPEAIANSARRAWLLAAIGEKDKALEIDLSAGRKFYKYRLYQLLKMKEEIIDYLNEDFERIKQSQESWYLWFMKFPLYKFLHSDPRFQEILAKHKKIYEENMRKYGDIDM